MSYIFYTEMLTNYQNFTIKMSQITSGFLKALTMKPSRKLVVGNKYQV